MTLQQKYIDETLQFISQKGYATSNDEFLKTAVKFLADLLKVDSVLINKYSIKTPKVTETLVIYNINDFVPNISYELENTPCNDVINKKLCVYPANVQQTFPKDKLLAEMKVNSYAGIPLWSSAGEPIGLIAILDNKPIKDSKTVEIILQIIAIKVEKILEKNLCENTLKNNLETLKLQKQRLEESEAKLLKAEEVTKMGFFEWNLKTNKILLSDEIIKLCGLDLKNKNIPIEQLTKLVHVDDQDDVQKKLKLALKGEKTYNTDYRIIRPDGEIIWVQAQANLIFDNQKKPTALLGTAVDITDRKKIALQLKSTYEIIKEKEDYLRAILKTANEGFWIIDTKAITLEVNLKMCEILGYTENEMIGKSIFEFVDTKNTEIFNKQLKDRALGKATDYEIELQKKNGENALCLFKTSPIYNKEKRRIGSFAMVSDISNLKNTYKQLEKLYNEQKQLNDELFEKNKLLFESKKRYINLFEQSPIALLEEDFSEVLQLLNKKKAETNDLENYLDENPDFLKECISKIQISKVNKNMLHLLGVKTTEELITHIRKTNTKKSFETLKKELLTFASNKKEFKAETEFINSDGKAIFAIIKSAIIDDNEKVIASIIDITNLKKTEEKLRESGHLLNESQKVAKLGSYILDFSTGLWESSDILDKLFGIDKNYKKDIFGWLNIVHPEDRKMMLEYFETDIIKNHNFFNKEYQIKRIDDNSERWMHGFGKLQFDKNGKLLKMIGTIQDITERKQTEQELQRAKEEAEKNEKKFRDLFEKSGDAELIIRNGIFIDCNQATIEMLKYKTKEDFLNSHPSKLSPKLQPDGLTSFEKADEMMKISLKNGTHRFEWMHTRSNGELFPVEVLLTAITNEHNNKIIHCVWRDITNRKMVEQELLKAKEKAEESDRLKTEFLHNMSHEIRTPMNGILGFSEFLSNSDLTEEKRNYFVKIIQNSGKQLLHIIDDILEISSLGTKQVKVEEKEVCLNDLLLELFSVFDIKAKENKTPLYLKNGLSDTESTILSDKTKLNKIMSNLLENALKFTNKGFIEFGYQLKNSTEHTELELYVKDTGIGIKPEKHQLIFERFSQAEKELSKNVGGLGLGLSIAKENTELLGGTISVDSDIMKGATFFVNIPYKPIRTNMKNEENKDTIQKRQTILIAEDEEVNFIFLEILLSDKIKLPCKVHHAKNGLDAVETCKLHPIDLILMDLSMPIMNGYEATKKIKELYPKLPIIAQTAYSTREDKEKAFAAGCDDFISKPIDKEELNRILSKYLKKAYIQL